MRNYLAAECYKTFRRKYFYIILAVCLGLEAVLLWGYWTTWKWGNSNVDFYSTAIMVPFMLSIGLYATIVTGDIVFSEQYKNNTLKNEVSYGLSRGRGRRRQAALQASRRVWRCGWRARRPGRDHACGGASAV